MLADKMARQWAGIERAMNFANHNPAFRPQVESLVNTYFALTALGSLLRSSSPVIDLSEGNR